MRLFALFLLCLTLSTVQGRVASVSHTAEKLPHATESADSPSPPSPHSQAARVPLAVAAAHSETLAVTVPTDNAHTTQTATPAGKIALRELQGRRPGGWGLLGVAKDLASGGAVFLQQLATGSVGNPFLDSPQYAPVGPLRKGPPRVIKNPFAEGKSVLGIQPGPRG